MSHWLKYLLVEILLSGAVSSVMYAQSVRERILLDDDWQFALGHADSPAKDFGCGTEYFNYLTKAASIHNEGPYSLNFDAAKWNIPWKTVNLPHDWVVDLPFAAEASHSHGYKTVGYQYPETSVGWYRKIFTLSQEDKGKHLWLQFDGIFRDARIWVNGFYLGHEPSGYATQIYDISEYLNYGGENLICVRVDASLQEGWFYEGAGIYRHVWLHKAAPVHIAPWGVFVYTNSTYIQEEAFVTVEARVVNSGVLSESYSVKHTLLTADGKVLEEKVVKGKKLLAKEEQLTKSSFYLCSADSSMNVPNKDYHLWSPDNPYLYTVKSEIWQDGRLVDHQETSFGIRQFAFHPNRGFLLNGERLMLKGVNMHQDHAGVGTAIPDDLQEYRLKQLKELGCNAYRSSHNPMTPAMLDACDRLGFLVIEENRLTGVNEEHVRLLRRMIERDRNHPSVILWSVGNEEWGIEWNEQGERVISSMREYCHRLDPTRPMTVATSGGPNIVIPADVAGYNYILQNPVDEHRKNYPLRCALGSEETTGCGTRGIYYPESGRMVAHNRKPNGRDSLLNCIERGWKFYDERPWLAGVFYWTGFDYRGEPNPLEFPATGSQFGILDYCGFPKDEAFYLKSWWKEDPVLHIFPHWNLAGHEGDSVDVWVYSNCDEVELSVNGCRLDRKAMPKNGHLAWKTVYRPGKVKAVGYINGKMVLKSVLETTGEPSRLHLSANRDTLKADNRSVAVARVEVLDKKKRFVPTACIPLTITVSGTVRILGVGNGDSAWQAPERPLEEDSRTFTVSTFQGLAQILLQSTGQTGLSKLVVRAEGMPAVEYDIVHQ